MNSSLDIFDLVHSLYSIHAYRYQMQNIEKDLKGPLETPCFHAISARHLVNVILCFIVKSNGFWNTFIIIFYSYTCMFGA